MMAPMSDRMPVEVHDNPAESRVEARTPEGAVAGFAEYRVDGDVLVFVHTEVDDAFEGQGVGSALARGAMSTARERGVRVRPECPFIAAYMRKHEQTHDLLVEDFDLAARARD